jgi:hypothetical protein
MKSVLCSLCVLCGLNLTAATLSPSTVHDDIPGTATIGEVSTAAGARNVADLGVYKIEKEPYLDDKYFPVYYEGREIPKANLILEDASSLGYSFHYMLYERDAYINGMGFNKDGDWLFADGWSFNGKLSPGWPKLSFRKKFTPTGDTLATSGEIGEVTGYARAVYNYMLGNTNAWFSGTNYPDHTSVAVKHKFEFEPGMDLATVPCSMALWEIRDGKRGAVWDQRDWVSWYWSFKAAQMRSEIAATNAAIIASIPRRAWGSYTANGLDNPDPTTVWVDRENTTLAAGMAWQNAIVVSGCGYWTIVGNGITLAPDEKRTSLDIRDFDGKSVMRIIKGESYLAPVTQEDFLAQGVDGAGRITFTIRSNVRPVGEYSTVLDTASFVAEDSENCPADWEWEQVDGGWKIHFLLKSGIVSNACFARFKVSVEGQSTIEYTTAPTISGGLIYNGVKIAPVISGDTVTWKVVK